MEEVQLKARMPEICCTTKNEKNTKTNAYPPYPGKTQVSRTSHIYTHTPTHTKKTYRHVRKQRLQITLYKIANPKNSEKLLILYHYYLITHHKK